MAARTRRRSSVFIVFVVFYACVFSCSHGLAGLIRRTLPPTFSDTAVTDRHSDTTIFQLREYKVLTSWSTGSEKSFGHVPPVGVEPSTSCRQTSCVLFYLILYLSLEQRSCDFDVNNVCCINLKMKGCASRAGGKVSDL